MISGSQLAREGILCSPGYNLGGKCVLTLNQPPQRILQLNAKSEQDPETIAISIDVKTLIAPAVGAVHLLRGRCVWGSKSGQQEIVFDLRHGCRMTLDASHIMLEVFGLSSAPSEAQWRVHASVTYGSVSGPSSLTFTPPPQSLAVGATGAKIEIPSYARRFACYTNDPAANYHADLYTSGAAGAPTNMRIAGSTNMVPVEIPNGLEFVDVSHTGGGGAVEFRPFFELVI